MESTFDSEFDDRQGLNVLHDPDPEYFQRDALEASDSESESDCDSVWLECTGELLDVGSANLVGVRNYACGFETLLFMCPRCRQPHESVRLRCYFIGLSRLRTIDLAWGAERKQ